MPHYTRLTAELELVTPAFIGGAINHAPRGLDPKSIKSALRYWWRVLNWSAIRQGCVDDASALRHLHQEEMRLFGATANNDGKGGQGLVQVVLRGDSSKPWLAPKQPPAGIAYLLGQGLYHYKTGILRTALAPCRFEIELILRHPRQAAPATNDVQQVSAALEAFGLLGALGSRQTRGFGSVTLLRIGSTPFAATLAQYHSKLAALFAAETNPLLPAIPALSNQSRGILLVPDAQGKLTVPALRSPDKPKNANLPARTVPASTAWDLLGSIGEQFMLERSWGRKDERKQIHLTSGGLVAEQNYRPDHDLIKAALRVAEYRHYGTQNPNALPLRSMYGLPYFFGQNIGVNLLLQTAQGKIATRRTSPFHIHLAHIDGQAVAVLYYLPACFAPAAAMLEMGALPARQANRVTFDFTVYERFLKRFPSAHALGTPAPAMPL